jgi:DNA mismatch repair protein MutS
MPTPMMEQYKRIKREHADAVLFFRMGDFYEMFFEDAKLASKVLGLTLTARSKGPDAAPMAGVPHHAVEGYLSKMIRAGYRVAICDQLEDPEDAEGLVERGVTRIVTPGTLTEEGLLEAKRANFLAAVCADEARVGLAWVDVSTGKFFARDIDIDTLGDELGRLGPAECLLPERRAQEAGDRIAAAVRGAVSAVTAHRDWVFDRDNARRILTEHFGTHSLEGFGCEYLGPGLSSAGALIDYLRETQRTSLAHISKMEPYLADAYCGLDRTTRRCLELTETAREGRREGSLVWVLDRAETPMGARLLYEWVTQPLRVVAEIAARQDGVESFVKDARLRNEARKILHEIGDMERLAAKISSGRCNARDLLGLKNSLRQVVPLRDALKGREEKIIAGARENLQEPPEIVDLIERAISADAPHTLREGGMIRAGYNAELDELHAIRRDGRQWIARFQAGEIERTGIPSLKVGFNQVFGYYIEVTQTHSAKIPQNYIRKQTLKNAERYITPELKEYESKVLHADERAKTLEYELFAGVRDAAAKHTPAVQRCAGAVAVADVLASLALVAAENNYARPRVTDEAGVEIREGRHPVLEKTLADEKFVPNDFVMDGVEHIVSVITGPNMAGKSTYIRQVALLVLMAQMGSFIPAKRAAVGVADRIFTRVGASDEIARGQSTFMVEMNETANILNNATPRSLIILDEVGRGTSTFDGVSIAWAVTEYIYNHLKARTLFATHYHELAELALVLPGVRNYNVAVKEWKDDVIFLRKIIEGSTDKSYGIHVARLAGLPKSVVERAKTILGNLEAETLDADGRPRFAKVRKPKPGEMQMALFAVKPHPVVDALRDVDVTSMTPIEALNKLNELKEMAQDKKEDKPENEM